MSWLWNSFGAYKNYVHPVLVDRAQIYNRAAVASLATREKLLTLAISKLKRDLVEIRKLGFENVDIFSRNIDILPEAKQLVMDIIFSGEEILLYHERLATSDYSYGFLHQHDLPQHWERYENNGRIFQEIGQLVEDGQALLDGCSEISEIDNRFLAQDSSMPSPIAGDFRLARDLFSVGLDEVAVFCAGRGFENVLRLVARRRRFRLIAKGTIIPAFDADLYDLIELFYRVRWKKTGDRLIDRTFRQLLHYLREIRNSVAHPSDAGKTVLIRPRETASLIASAAGSLWNRIVESRDRLRGVTVKKTW